MLAGSSGGTEGGVGSTMGWLRRWVPGVGVLRSYDLATAGHDAFAAVVLMALLVPAGMGYAVAAGLPPITGLYATAAPLAVYALVGPSRILVLGPDSSLTPLIAATVVPMAAGDPDRAVALASALALLAGAICVVAGLARFGFITDLLSLPVRYGYLAGIALTVVASQLPALFGFSDDAHGFIGTVVGFARGVADGDTNPTALTLGSASLVVILLVHRFAPRVPGVLVAMIGSILAVVGLDLADRGLALVGELPRGLPGVGLPDVAIADIGPLLGAAVGIAVVSFADTSVLSRSFATRGRYEVDADQELVALGLANVGSAMCQGFSVSASASRTPVAESAGARTQLTGLFAAGMLAVLLVAAPGLFRNLPSTALAAVVIAAAVRIVEVGPIVRLARARRSEFVLAAVAFLAVVLTGPITGVGIAIGVSLLNFIRKAWRPHSTELVRVDGLKGYHDAERHPEGRRVPGLLLFRFDAPLFFANAGEFAEQIRTRIARAVVPVRWVVVTAEPITDIDATAAATLESLHRDLAADGIVLAFAELKGHVREQLDRFGLVRRVGPERFYRTVGEAVHAFVAAEGVDWVDWEDRLKP